MADSRTIRHLLVSCLHLKIHTPLYCISRSPDRVGCVVCTFRSMFYHLDHQVCSGFQYFAIDVMDMHPHAVNILLQNLCSWTVCSQSRPPISSAYAHIALVGRVIDFFTVDTSRWIKRLTVSSKVSHPTDFAFSCDHLWLFLVTLWPSDGQFGCQCCSREPSSGNRHLLRVAGSASEDMATSLSLSLSFIPPPPSYPPRPPFSPSPITLSSKKKKKNSINLPAKKTPFQPELGKNWTYACFSRIQLFICPGHSFL